MCNDGFLGDGVGCCIEQSEVEMIVRARVSGRCVLNVLCLPDSTH